LSFKNFLAVVNKCHNETHGVAIINSSVFFSKMRDKKVKRVVSGDWYQWEMERYKEGVK
jgi:hypothetical protein